MDIRGTKSPSLPLSLPRRMPPVCLAAARVGSALRAAVRGAG